jgi:hypothetical protein
MLKLTRKLLKTMLSHLVTTPTVLSLTANPTRQSQIPAQLHCK